MVYVFDTSSFIVLSHYYNDRFPSLWKRINDEVKFGRIISVKEVFNEIESYGPETNLKTWVRENKKIFYPMTGEAGEESQIVSDIFREYPKFQNMISQKSLQQGRPVADPVIVAKAIHIKGAVVSEETFQKDGIKIPNLCQIQKISCFKLKEFMEKQNWKF